ncbi:sirohydrochlorin chelatase [Micromonospora sp. NPDC094482]|uniref:sirohydrochlorin chelatase n=1 Tax=unclassified Micromonospora TaxID=2617518 RepID=UPI003325C617
MSAPALVLVAHGTRSPAGQAQIRGLTRTVAEHAPELDLHLSYLDVQRPRLAEVAPRLDRPAVVVPLLLSAGYHVRVDIPNATAGRDITVTPPLGPDPELVDVLTGRIAAAGPADAVVLAAAGSSDARSRADVASVAGALSTPARVGYASTSTPRVSEVIAELRAEGARRVVVAAYLLGDGIFHRSLRRAGADAVTAPLVTSLAIARLVLDRYAAAVAGRSDVARVMWSHRHRDPVAGISCSSSATPRERTKAWMPDSTCSATRSPSGSPSGSPTPAW